MLPAAIKEKYANVAAHGSPLIHCTLTVVSVDQVDDICEQGKNLFRTIAAWFTVEHTESTLAIACSFMQ